MYSSSLSRITSPISITIHENIVTPAPLFNRQQDPLDCSQAEQSASRASQQAFQQASQSIQQASQSASQAIQQVSQSASNSIQSASQQVAAASRSSVSVVSSASSAIASIQASANQAISKANGAMQSAILSASLLQQDASKIGADTATAREQAQESQNAAITATQAALAIVGSIIASTLLTILVFWCISRYRRKKQQQSKDRSGKQYDYPKEKPPIPMIEKDESVYQRKDTFGSERRIPTSTISPSPNPYNSNTRADQKGNLSYENKPTMNKRYLAWNPKNPPKAPTLNSWLQFDFNNEVSSVTRSPIKLPTAGTTDEKRPLGGQIKSPLSMIPTGTTKIPNLDSSSAVNVGVRNGRKKLKQTPFSRPDREVDLDTELHDNIQEHAQRTAETGKDSVWTDDKRSTFKSSESALPLAIPSPEFKMGFPRPEHPVRNTAEWLLEQQQQQPQGEQNRAQKPPKLDYLRSPTRTQNFIRESLLKDIESPSPRTASRIMSNGLPRTPKLGVSVSIRSIKGEVHFIEAGRGGKGGKRGDVVEARRIEGIGEGR